MTKLTVRAFSLSIDGYGSGPDQNLDNPLGRGGESLHDWMSSSPSGTAGIDDEFARRSFDNVGAWIMGRNMYGPVRGGWPDDSWRGWWGENPPFHVPVFVLTHHQRDPVEMEGGTTFHFVTDGIEAALERAREAAGGKDVRIGGGAATIREYLRARLIDEMHIAIAPILLGGGESLFAGVDMPEFGYAVTEHVPGEGVTHLIITRKS